MASCAESSEIRIISPIGAAVRSLIPGWGQIYTHDRIQGVAIFLAIGILGGGGIEADAIYRDYYNNKYRPAIIEGSSQADFYFDRSNQYYKLSRFLLYTAGGIWAYSIIDAYVDAHLDGFDAQMREFRDELDEAVAELDLHYDSLKSAASQRLG